MVIQSGPNLRKFTEESIRNRHRGETTPSRPDPGFFDEPLPIQRPKGK